jgi:hypothetical protein
MDAIEAEEQVDGIRQDRRTSLRCTNEHSRPSGVAHKPMPDYTGRHVNSVSAMKITLKPLQCFRQRITVANITRKRIDKACSGIHAIGDALPTGWIYH